MNYSLLFSKTIILLPLGIVILVGAPFLIWGEAFAQPLLEAQAHRTGLLVVFAVGLLGADSVAPVPATLVIMFLAAKAGWLAGVVGGTVGLSLGVLAAAWVGHSAVGRMVPRFFPESELVRLRAGLQGNPARILGCWRSVPVLAEASVILAGAAAVPIKRIFRSPCCPTSPLPRSMLSRETIHSPPPASPFWPCSDSPWPSDGATVWQSAHHARPCLNVIQCRSNEMELRRSART